MVASETPQDTQLSSSLDTSWMRPGMEAILCNLSKFPKLEGKTVQLFSWLEEKQRWKCILPEGGDVNVFTKNLEPVEMPMQQVQAIERMLEEEHILEAWYTITSSARAPQKLHTDLETKLSALSQIEDEKIKIVETVSKRTGFRAQKQIHHGEVLLTDTALCSQKVSSASPTTSIEGQAQHNIWLEMGRNSPRVARFLERNALRCTREPDHVAYFATAARFNHSCCPNAFADSSASKCIVRALRDIGPGEEVCISYIPVSDSIKLRQTKLNHYGFTCACMRCYEEGQTDPHAEVPCQCGGHVFMLGTFQEGIMMLQQCELCWSRFDTQACRENLAIVAAANARQSDTMKPGSEQYEAVWMQLKRLAPLEKLVTDGANNGIPPLHPESILLLNNLAALHHHLAMTRFKGNQRKQALENVCRLKKICLDRLAQMHSKASRQRDQNYIQTLAALTACEEGLNAEERAHYKNCLRELCNLCFGQSEVPSGLIQQ